MLSKSLTLKRTKIQMSSEKNSFRREALLAACTGYCMGHDEVSRIELLKEAYQLKAHAILGN